MTKSLKDYAKEWLDTLVVAISVAMAFRAYFYEPFNIPTGSMQPTLYGNHFQPCENPGVWETTPLKWLNWLATGRDYKELVAPFDGEVYAEKRADDGRVVVYVASALKRSEEIKVPDDALTRIAKSLSDGTETLMFVPPYVTHIEKFLIDGIEKLMFVSPGGETESRAQVLRSVRSNPGSSILGVYPYRVKKGQKIFAGYDTSGDFVFVNRWKWNFRKPARGDVMVFSTTGIDGLKQQGTHYIKRVTALPNETIEITKGGDVVIDGKVMPPLKPMTGARGEATPKPNPGRSKNGFAMNGKVKLGDNEYFTCGDNSNNSLDSRYWGAVPEKKVTGNAACVFWPIINPRWGTIK